MGVGISFFELVFECPNRLSAAPLSGESPRLSGLNPKTRIAFRCGKSSLRQKVYRLNHPYGGLRGMLSASQLVLLCYRRKMPQKGQRVSCASSTRAIFAV
jgi:hypothetical protein